MEARDLMIGDWVWYNNQPHQIRQLGIFGVDRDGEDYPAVCVGKPNGIGLILERNEIEPIPLTPEILEKNGFGLKEESDSYKKYIAGDELCIIVFYFYKETIYGVSTLLRCERGFAGGLDRIHKCNLLYVHQLQHALKLCGINQNIEL